jgi:hypothetical protein
MYLLRTNISRYQALKCKIWHGKCHGFLIVAIWSFVNKAGEGFKIMV